MTERSVAERRKRFQFDTDASKRQQERTDHSEYGRTQQASQSSIGRTATTASRHARDQNGHAEAAAHQRAERKDERQRSTDSVIPRRLERGKLSVSYQNTTNNIPNPLKIKITATPNSAPIVHPPLLLECDDDELSDAQIKDSVERRKSLNAAKNTINEWKKKAAETRALDMEIMALRLAAPPLQQASPGAAYNSINETLDAQQGLAQPVPAPLQNGYHHVVNSSSSGIMMPGQAQHHPGSGGLNLDGQNSFPIMLGLRPTGINATAGQNVQVVQSGNGRPQVNAMVRAPMAQMHQNNIQPAGISIRGASPNVQVLPGGSLKQVTAINQAGSINMQPILQRASLPPIEMRSIKGNPPRNPLGAISTNNARSIGSIAPVSISINSQLGQIPPTRGGAFHPNAMSPQTYRPQRSLTPTAVNRVPSLPLSGYNLIGTDPSTAPVGTADKPVSNLRTSAAQKKSPAATKVSSAPPCSSPDIIPLDVPKGQQSSVATPKLAPAVSGRTFPSLVVMAKPVLSSATMSSVIAQRKRQDLDTKVKMVLIFEPAKLTEWLLQQGLILSQQKCRSHAQLLKLGMYSDVSKFPQSGGYVWISECCKNKFVSVFQGSIFDGSPHPPPVLVKLLYHWSCQTAVQNVIQWVKVDSSYIKSFYTYLRSACVVAVQQYTPKLGGPGRVVEIGIVSLGTTSSQEGSARQIKGVKVEILGILDKATRFLRLRASEPDPAISPSDPVRERFVRILQPLRDWVDPSSTIFTDVTVDGRILHDLGFTNVQQCGSGSMSNSTIMDYLRRVIPRMFQNTLSLLSRNLIQQFLDELVWRERWGSLPLNAFNTMMIHLNEQSKAETAEPLLNHLSKVAANPFTDWRLPHASSYNPNCQPGDQLVPSLPQVTPISAPVNHIPIKGKAGPAAEAAKKASVVKSNDPPGQKKVDLTTCYYSMLPGDITLTKRDENAKIVYKCHLCDASCSGTWELTSHFAKHIQLETWPSDGGMNCYCCRYCLQIFSGMNLCREHEQKFHLKETEGLMCRICNFMGSDGEKLIQHMTLMHVPNEMPYMCGACGFRSSLHHITLEHFYKVHGFGGRLMCPFCLFMVVAAPTSTCMWSEAVSSFHRHMELHMKGAKAYQCTKCLLKCLSQKEVKLHLEKDHASFRAVKTVRPINFPKALSNVEMVLPPSYLKPPPPSSNKMTQVNVSSKNAFHMDPLTVTLFGVAQDDICVECQEPLIKPDHINGYSRCVKCRFATCCYNSLQDHSAMHSDLKCSRMKPRKSTALMSYISICECGFSSEFGNQIANHLVECEKDHCVLNSHPSSKAVAGHCKSNGHSDTESSHSRGSTENLHGPSVSKKKKIAVDDVDVTMKGNSPANNDDMDDDIDIIPADMLEAKTELGEEDVEIFEADTN